MSSEFRKELETLINSHSMENGSNTPDFILADFLTDCLQAFDKATVERHGWKTRGTTENPITDTESSVSEDDAKAE